MVCKVVETLSRRKVDLCCVQETRQQKNIVLKLRALRNSKGTADVEVFVAENWTEQVFEVKRVSDRIIMW